MDFLYPNGFALMLSKLYADDAAIFSLHLGRYDNLGAGDTKQLGLGFLYNGA